MKDTQCRLCSSTSSLISLFSGKSRKNRDIIRKLTFETVHIQFEEGDVYACICYSCVTQVYNIYIFKIRSQENDKRLQETGGEYVRTHKGKHVIIPLNDLWLPEIKVLKETFTPWLLEKLNVIEELEDNDYLDSENCINLNKTLSTEDKCIQFSPSIESQETQCDSRYLTDNVAIQTLHEVKNKSVQCNNVLHKRNVRVQAGPVSKDRMVQCLLRGNTVEKYCQYEESDTSSSSISKASYEFKDKYVQSEITTKPFPVEKECRFHESEKFWTQTDSNGKFKCFEGEFNDSLKSLLVALLNRETEKTHKSSNSKLSNVKGKLNEEILILMNAIGAKSHFMVNTDVFSSKTPPVNSLRSKEKFKESLCSNKREVSSDWKMKENNKSRLDSQLINQYDTVKRERCRNMSEACSRSTVETDQFGVQNNNSISADLTKSKLSHPRIDLKNNLYLDTKRQTNNEICCMQPSPTKSLNMAGISRETELGSSPVFASATAKYFPNKPEVSQEVGYVRVCRHCDATLYSKAELRKHRTLHIKCKLCNKSFRSIEQRKYHFTSHCDEKLSKLKPTVDITRLNKFTMKRFLDKLHRENHAVNNESFSNSEDFIYIPSIKKVKMFSHNAQNDR